MEIQMEIADSIEKGTIGSLLALFQSEYFSIEMIIQYLYKYMDRPPIVDFLINKLYTREEKEFRSYLPQLCYISLIRESQSLNRLLLDMCANDILNYMKISWFIQGYGSSPKKGKAWIQKSEKLERFAEMSMVNAERREGANTLFSSNNNKSEEELFLKFREKEMRSNFNNSMQKFLHSLIKISYQLKDINPEIRTSNLKKKIKKLNHWIEKTRSLHKNENDNPFLYYYEGILFPFDTTSESSQIVHIIEEESYAFSTRKRVPYKITFETINKDDLEFHVPINNFSQTSNQDNFNRTSMDTESEIFTFRSQSQNSISKSKNYENLEKFAKEIELEETKINHEIPKQTANHLSLSEIKEFEKRIELFNEIFPIKDKFGRADLKRRNSNEAPELQHEIPKINKKFISGARRSMPEENHISFLESVMKSNPEKKEKILDIILKERKLSQELEDDEHIIKDPWGEIWESKERFYKRHSPYGHFPTYMLRNFIIKGDDDLRQELLAMQLIRKIKEICLTANIHIWLRTYEIIVTSDNSGFIEFIPDTITLDAIKKKYKNIVSLKEFYLNAFNVNFEEATKNFVESLAGYCICCYLFAIKDRHNANILIDADGHIIHIDFGFILSNCPGGINFESAPFKMTQDYIDVMGGKDSNMFLYFKVLMIKGFMEIRKHVNSICYLVQIMAEQSDLPCFSSFNFLAFKSRFMENTTDQECIENVERLLDSSMDNWRTLQYDNFQKLSNGIYQ